MRFRPFRVVFGGIKPGAAASAGPEVTHAFHDGSVVKARAETSVPLYEPGADSPENRALYAERRTEFSVEALQLLIGFSARASTVF
jgi:hypothetical protein